MSKGNYDMGIAFDGDGDRILIISSQGTILDGDDILFILSQKMPPKFGCCRYANDKQSTGASLPKK